MNPRAKCKVAAGEKQQRYSWLKIEDNHPIEDNQTFQQEYLHLLILIKIGISHGTSTAMEETAGSFHENKQCWVVNIRDLDVICVGACLSNPT